jgi:hypothetical protein
MNYIVNDRQSTLIPRYPSAINVNNTRYPEGTINPIEKKTITKVINIDSSFRQNYTETTSTNFLWDLHKKESNVVAMRVSSIDIPVAWYSISEINNRNEFNITVHNWKCRCESTLYTITIPPGNYFSCDFINTLNGIFKTIGGGLLYLVAEIDANTAKTIIRLDPSNYTGHLDCAHLYFEIDFFPNRDIFTACSPHTRKNTKHFHEFQRRVGWYMGFRNYDYIVNKSNNVAQTTFNTSTLLYRGAIASESTYSNSQANYCFLAIDDHHNNCVSQSIVSSTGESYISNNILARITVNTLPNAVLYDNGRDKIFKERIYMGPITLDKLKISLLNKYGEVIDLNGVDISFTLELTELY